MTVVAAYDVATDVGFSTDDPKGEGRPIFATFHGPRHAAREDYGVRYAAFRAWMVDTITVHQPELIAIEAPLMPRGDNMKTNLITVRLLMGLAAVAEEVAATMGVRCVEENVQTIKKHFAGTGRADKDAMLARCRQLGWAVANHHEADAAALWSYCKAKTDPKFQYSTTPLFAEGRA